MISTERIAQLGARHSHAGAHWMSCTPDEREALVKVANGDTCIGREHMRRLFMMRLVERPLRIVQLTAVGRALLGLPD